MTAKDIVETMEMSHEEVLESIGDSSLYHVSFLVSDRGVVQVLGLDDDGIIAGLIGEYVCRL